MILAPIITALGYLTPSTAFGYCFSCKLCHWIRGLCTKNGLNQKFWAHLLSVMVCGLHLKVEIYQDMVGSHLTFCIIFKLKHVFSFLLLMIHMLNNSHSIEYHGNNVQNPIRTYPIIALHEHYAIFHVLELYSTNQIPLCPFRLCSIMCHFLVSNLHFITYSKCIFQPTKKNSHRTKWDWWWTFHATATMDFKFHFAPLDFALSCVIPL